MALRITLTAFEDGAKFRIFWESGKESEIAWAIAHLELVKKQLLEMLERMGEVEVGAEGGNDLPNQK